MEVINILILLLTFVYESIPLSLCPDGSWYSIDGGICYWLQTVPLSATDSNAMCAQQGGTLAVFPSWKEYNFIVYGTAPTYITPVIAGQLWIGMTDAVTEGTFVSFEGNPTTYVVWHANNPTENATMNKDCVYMDSNNYYDMFDEDCDILFPSLCSFTLGYCPSGSYYLADKLVCYWKTSTAVEAAAGDLLCAADSGNLAVILDADVNTALGASPMNSLLTSGSVTELFIGVTDAETETVYKSFTGDLITWFNWKTSAGEPNDPDNPSLGTQDCVTMDTATREWSDIACVGINRQALCYRDLTAFAFIPTTTSQPDPVTTETTTTTTEVTTTDQTTSQETTNVQATAGTTETSTSTTTTNQNIQTTEISTTQVIQGQCECPCEETLSLTPEEVEKVIEEIKAKLTVDVKTTSSYIRTKTSAYETRPAAQSLGAMGIAILCIVFGGVIIMDLGTLFRHIKNCGKLPT